MFNRFKQKKPLGYCSVGKAQFGLLPPSGVTGNPVRKANCFEANSTLLTGYNLYAVSERFRSETDMAKTENER